MSRKANAVREMFDSIAHRYDFLNHFLSLNIDRRWRRACVEEASRRTDIAEPRILDVGCGTGDLSLEFANLGPVTGCDFSHNMLRIGKAKAGRYHQGRRKIHMLEADGLALPFRDDTFDIVVSAFVLRNLADPRKGLDEMRRVLRPGGILGMLDFSMPRIPVLAWIYRCYFLRILPRLGTLISGVQGPYRYLPNSVRSFYRPEELQVLISHAGFGKIHCRLLSGGIAVLLLAESVDRSVDS
jgi:demethylmenaquinone methyltransferase/2-methoxy-6-polyprenyl-1,4-benzoquinol methylase